MGWAVSYKRCWFTPLITPLQERHIKCLIYEISFPIHESQYVGVRSMIKLKLKKKPLNNELVNDVYKVV